VVLGSRWSKTSPRHKIKLDVSVTVDGERIPGERVRFTVGGQTFALDEMETEYEARWEFGEVAAVTVLKRGGLAQCQHKIELSCAFRTCRSRSRGGMPRR
jgi:hypothetical protein